MVIKSYLLQIAIVLAKDVIALIAVDLCDTAPEHRP